MADCEVLEKDCSHYVPALFGSVISTIVIALGLFAFDKAMALVGTVGNSRVGADYRAELQGSGQSTAKEYVGQNGLC